MRNLLTLLAIAVLLTVAACNDKPKTAQPAEEQTEEKKTSDFTIYGVCGEGTAMHTLQLITDAGDTLEFMIDDQNGDNPVVGGLLAGDRLAVVQGPEMDGDKTVSKVINLTTLQGKWTSLDKNFEIMEGGKVLSHVQAEKNPWTSWKILNGKLLLNRDTFDIDELGSDSLFLENKEGIFVYKRVE